MVTNSTLTFKGLLFAVVYGIMILLLSGVFVLNVWQKRLYLEEQLMAVSQDAASSLGLSLTSVANLNDWVAASSMVDAIFDSGAYLSIELEKPQGGVILTRKASLELEGVPAWFISLLPLYTPEGRSEVMSGWTQAAVLTVISHPGFAYRDLWRTVKLQGLLFFGLGLFTLLLLKWLLHLLLKPLSNLETAARKVQSRDFSIRLPLPATQELRRVTESVNTMAGTLQRSFDEQFQTIELLRQQAFVDALTGLMNRKAFDERFKVCLSDENEASGVLMLIDLPSLSSMNLNTGRSQVDDVLLTMARILEDEASVVMGSFVGRLSAGSFAAFLPGAEKSVAEVVATNLASRFTGLDYFAGNPDFTPGIGLVWSEFQDDMSKLLSAADFVVSRRVQRGEKLWQWYSDDGRKAKASARTASEWQQLLTDALSKGRFSLFFQPVREVQRSRILFQQVLIRLNDHERQMNAAEFMAMVERFRLSLPLDMLVIEKTLEQIKSGGHESAMAVQLSASSLCDIELYGQLKERLKKNPGHSERLLLTCPQWALQNCRAGFEQLIRLRNEFGFRMVVSRLGMTDDSLKLIKDTGMDAVLLDPALTVDVTGDSQRQYYLRSIVQIAHAQGSLVIAAGVENENSWKTLVEAGIDGAMGFYIAHPQSNPVHL